MRWGGGMTAAAGGSGFLRLALSFFPHHFPLHRNGVGAFPLNSTLPLLWSSFFFRCYAQGFDFFFLFLWEELAKVVWFISF